MSRLSKAQIRAHQEAEALLTLDVLDDDQREFVLENWQESARHVNSAAGAFFTPSTLASDLAVFSQAGTVIDLCAGIGALGLWTWWRSDRRAQVTCVEVNPDYVAVGRKVFPEATWVCASVETAPTLGQFDIAVSNPPFGRTAKIKTPRYSGEDDLAVLDIASDCATFATFILPQGSCPFEYSGRQDYRRRPSPKWDRFAAATGIEIEVESVDCAYALKAWRGVAPRVEMVSADFTAVQARRQSAQSDLFERLAA